MNNSEPDRVQTAATAASFDDEVRTSARNQARLLRDLGYRADATRIERFVNQQD